MGVGEPETPPRTSGSARGWARLGWFVAFWCAGVLALTAIGLAIRFMLKM